jgi:hypothetical protein
VELGAHVRLRCRIAGDLLGRPPLQLPDPGTLRSYWRLSRAPRYSLLFALPLLVLYELSAFLLAGDPVGGMRNGADVVLKSVFLSFGGQHGLLAFNALLLGAGAGLVVRDMRRNRQGRQPGIVLGMAASALVKQASFLAVGLPIVLFMVPNGGVDPRRVGLVYGGLLTTTFALAGMSAAASVLGRSRRTAVGWSLLLAMAWLVAGPAFVFFFVIAPIGAEQLFFMSALVFWFAVRADLTRAGQWLVLGFLCGAALWVHQGNVFLLARIAAAA